MTSSFSIGHMNTLLKKYTDTLLTLHGIPLTGDFESDYSLWAEHTSARKSLETDMWRLTEEVERLKALGEETLKYNCETITHFVQKHRDEMLKMLEENERLREKNEKLETKAVRLAKTVKDLRDHIADSRGDADERAERYETILENADKALNEEFPNQRWCRPKKFKDYSPYNTEEETETDEETEDEDEELA